MSQPSAESVYDMRDKWSGILQNIAVSVAEEGPEPDYNVKETLLNTATGEKAEDHHDLEAIAKLKLNVPLVCARYELVASNNSRPSRATKGLLCSQIENLSNSEQSRDREKINQNIQIIKQYQEEAIDEANKDQDEYVLLRRIKFAVARTECNLPKHAITISVRETFTTGCFTKTLIKKRIFAAIRAGEIPLHACDCQLSCQQDTLKIATMLANKNKRMYRALKMLVSLTRNPSEELTQVMDELGEQLRE